MNDGYQLVRGMVDGESERRWILAYQNGGERWYGYDWDVIINEIDAIIQIDQLDILAIKLKEQQIDKDYINEIDAIIQIDQLDIKLKEQQIDKDYIDKLRDISECPPDCGLEDWLRQLPIILHENNEMNCNRKKTR